MTSILIVDDHPIVRDGLEVLLASEKDFKIHGAVASAEEALALCGKNLAGYIGVDNLVDISSVATVGITHDGQALTLNGLEH